LNPPVTQQWIEFGPAFGHPLDLFYYSDCLSGNEPAPCGSAGCAFQTALPFIQSVTSRSCKETIMPNFWNWEFTLLQ
jgi:hypothetical protein